MRRVRRSARRPTRRSLVGARRACRRRTVDSSPTCSSSAPARRRGGRHRPRPLRVARCSWSTRPTFPRDKCCGDGLTTLALRELEPLGLDPATVPSWQTVDDAVAALAVGPGGAAAAARRRAVRRDRAAARARRRSRRPRPRRRGHGARRPRADAPSASRRPRRRPTSTASGTVRRPLRRRRRRHVVAGAQAARPRRGRLPRRVARLPPVRGDVTGPAADRLYVWFEPDLLPGYAWSFPLPDGRANLGFGVLRDGGTGADMKRAVAGAAGPRRTSPRRSARTSSSRDGTTRGRSRPASTGPR